MNELTTQTQTQTTISLTTGSGFDLAQRVAKMLASSQLVPKEYQGPSGVANCLIALNIANRINADPLMVCQSLVIIHGRPSWSSQFLIASFNACGRYTGIRYEFSGEPGTDEYGCLAMATELASGEVIKGARISIKMAKDEGWYGRNGSKWKTLPQQMLMYRAASFFVGAYAPELKMGMVTQEEAIDIGSTPSVNVNDRIRTINAIEPDPLVEITEIEPDPLVEITEIEPETDQQAPPDDEDNIFSSCTTLAELSRFWQKFNTEEKKMYELALRKRQKEIKSSSNS